MAPRLTTTAANQLRPPSTGSRATTRRMTPVGQERQDRTGSGRHGAAEEAQVATDEVWASR
jgi:hypothetical protein